MATEETAARVANIVRPKLTPEQNIPKRVHGAHPGDLCPVRTLPLILLPQIHPRYPAGICFGPKVRAARAVLHHSIAGRRRAHSCWWSATLWPSQSATF